MKTGSHIIQHSLAFNSHTLQLGFTSAQQEDSVTWFSQNNQSFRPSRGDFCSNSWSKAVLTEFILLLTPRAIENALASLLQAFIYSLEIHLLRPTTCRALSWDV